MNTNKKSILDLMEQYNYPKSGKYLLQDMYCFEDIEKFCREYYGKINLEEYTLIKGDFGRVSNIKKDLSDSLLFKAFNPKPLEESR